jgi:hypothetical protein
LEPASPRRTGSARGFMGLLAALEKASRSAIVPQPFKRL